jgi:hypothetical protein
MALNKGDINASTGMAKAIYDKLQEVLLPDAAAGGGDLSKLQETWQKLAYAIAAGVVEHIVASEEISGIKTKWYDTTPVYGVTSTNSGHSHTVTVKGTVSGVEFAQSNDGLNHAK